ncbi:unnamed protein product [Trifolium pratense]|uniref:Uncharacterized protein n=1 Tax=Trifolium pratense TaxID=57577 RepID=A0ACB0KZH5_TRIPR|nr:unnamed protein product [Trifolium pratense]
MMKECDFHYAATVMHKPKKRLREFGDAADSHCYSLADQCGLRLRRRINGDWVPPLLPPQEKPPEMKKKLKLIIKFTGKSKNESKFKKGETVEVSDGNEGYKGAWFVATVIDTLEKERFLVEYRDLVTNDDGTRPLKEEIDAKFIRPSPPYVPNFGSFKKLQEVDAWYNDAWWEGVVVELVNTTECSVRFMNNEVLKIECSKLRPHQDWINGKWIMSSKESSELVKKFGDVMPKANNLAGTKLILKYPIPCENAKQPTAVITRTLYTGSKFDLHFYKGEKVEIRSDEKGYEGSWYTATVVDFLHNGKYLVEYSTLKTDDLTEPLKEEINVSDIRPCPPEVDRFCRYVTRQRVDVWFNDGWWEGVVSNVAHGFNGFEYKVYFWTSNEELEFEHCYLRPHQDWIDGRWMLASLV